MPQGELDMDLKIESRNVTMTPRWKEEIEARAAELAALHPETTHIRVQLSRNGHQHKGHIAEALLVVSFPRRHTVTARKEKDTFEEAIRAAFSAAEVELKKFREKRAEPGVTRDSETP
jgi:ribosome-associated translation inhibitor RaiA